MIQKQESVAVNKFKEYQDFVKEIGTKKIFKVEERIDWAVKEMVAEAGEVLSLAAKATRKGIPIDRDKLFDELSDTLWGVAAIMNEAFPDKSLDDLIDYNVSKLTKRYSDPIKLKEIT